MSMKKSVWIIFLMLGLLLTAGCGKKADMINASKDYIYHIEEIDLKELIENSSVSNMSIREDTMYLSGYEWIGEEPVMTLFSRKIDGSTSGRIELRPGEGKNYTKEIPDGKGNYYLILNEYSIDERNPESVLYRDDYFLVKLDASGTEVWKQPLNQNIPEGEGYWVQWMKLLPDDRIALCDNQGLFLYDQDGNRVKKVEIQTEHESSDAFQLANGDIVIQCYNDQTNQVVLNRLNADTGEVSQDYEIPGSTFGYSIYTGSGCDLFLTSSDGIYAYNLGDTELRKLMDFVDSDLDVPYLQTVAGVSERELYALSNDQNTGETILLKMTKVDPEDVVEKTMLTLACYGLDWDVRTEVVNFNKTNPRYRIQILDYAQYSTEEDMTAGLTRLNTDLSSGKVPDILLLNQQLPIESYAAKGLFEDLYPWLDQDQELDRTDFFENVLRAYESGGSLYRLTPSFLVRTVAAKTADVGKEPGWTMEDLEALMKNKPEGTESFGEMDRANMLRFSIQMCADQFIDWETGSCNFDSEQFICLLNFIRQFPDTLGEDYYNEDFWMNQETQWREGRVVLQQMYLDSFSSYNHTKKVTFGEDITLIGFPVQEGNGAALLANMELAMMSKSSAKEGAWEFLRIFLTEEYQKTLTYGIPLRLDRARELMAEAMKRPSFENENGEIEEYDDVYMIGGIELVVTPMTKQEADELMEYLYSVDQIFSYNEELVSIVQEEAEAFFAGQKTAENTAEIIQSRVEIYVNENR